MRTRASRTAAPSPAADLRGKVTYVALRPGLRLVTGPKRSAIYEMKTGRVYAVDPFSTRVLALAIRNVPAEEIPRRLRLGRDTRKRRAFAALLHHPFLRRSQEPNRAEASPSEPAPARLRFLWIELTAVCNLRCRHCYAASGPDREPGALTGEDYRRLVREAAALGVGVLQFTGGEIFLRPDLIDLVREAREEGIGKVELYTNATLIREPDLDAIARLGASLAVSLYSHRPEVHDAITLKPGSWLRTVDNLRRILAKGIPLRVGVILMDANRGDAEGTRRFLAGLGVPEGAVRFDTVRPAGRGCEGGLAEPDPPLVKLGPPERFRPEGERLSARTCWSGKLAVDPDGNAYPCVFSRGLPVGNVRGSSLAEVIGGAPARDLWSITLEKVEDCRDCEYRYACFDCRLLAYARTGNLLAKPPACGYLPHAGTVERAAGMPVRAEPLPIPLAPRARPTVTLRRVGGETYLWDRETRAMHLLNPTAARIWRWCDGKSTREEIVDRMCRKYGAGRERIDRDVGRTLAAFRELGVVE